MLTKTIGVLVVEDSPVAQLLLVHLINSQPDLNVIGTAKTGQQAMDFLQRAKPDVIVMDIHMPGIDGFETTRRIMESLPVPIIICTGTLNPTEVSNTFRAMEAGALALVGKPVGPDHPEHERLSSELITTIRTMSEVKVVRRWNRNRPRTSGPPALDSSGGRAKPVLVGIGASTGGPPALQAIFSRLPTDFPLPVVVVQHISPGFLGGLVNWLNDTSGLPIHIAADGELVKPGHIYMAPDGLHMGIGKGLRIALSAAEPDRGLQPSVGHLFRSMCETCGASAIAVLMTGMGDDGAREMKALRDVGALTIAQDAETSIVHGMPGEAIKRGGAELVLPAEAIALALVRHVKASPGAGY